ncbi:MAG: hypothetical protein V3S31_02275, partial [Dehalococcoidia bacterium]
WLKNDHRRVTFSIENEGPQAAARVTVDELSVGGETVGPYNLPWEANNQNQQQIPTGHTVYALLAEAVFGPNLQEYDWQSHSGQPPTGIFFYRAGDKSYTYQMDPGELAQMRVTIHTGPAMRPPFKNTAWAVFLNEDGTLDIQRQPHLEKGERNDGGL